jgi:hypothetical protein
LEDVKLIPNFCNYVETSYQPLKNLKTSFKTNYDFENLFEILIGPARGINDDVLLNLKNELKKFNFQKKNIENDYESNHSNKNKNKNIDEKNPKNVKNITINTIKNLEKKENKKFIATTNELKLKTIRELYPKHFEYSKLSTFFAIVLLPYQVSFMSFFEFYRMNIPIFVPTGFYFYLFIYFFYFIIISVLFYFYFYFYFFYLYYVLFIRIYNNIIKNL